MKTLHILLADDHQMVRKGLRLVIEENRGWKICAEASTGREAVAKACDLKPDIVIMDFNMPELNGMEATRQIRAALPKTEVLILTASESEGLVKQMLAAGAGGYVLKADSDHSLVDAITALSEHKPYFTARIAAFVLKGYLNPKTRDSAELSPREREIIQLVAEGKPTKIVADTLNISIKTVETHRTNLMRKLGLHSVVDLTRYAIRNEIVQA